MSAINTISFVLPNGWVAQYSNDHNGLYASIFNAQSNLMTLPILPGDYTSRVRSLGPTDVIEGVSGSHVRTAETRQEATIRTPKGFIVIKEVVNRLRDAAIANGTYTLTIHDGCEVEYEDISQGYTLRKWWLKQPVVPEGAQAHVQGSGDRIYAGYTFEFTAFGRP